MTTRKAYAISKDGKVAYMFQSKALRDFFAKRVLGIEPTTCAEYRRVERMAREKRDEWGYRVDSKYSANDMSVDEYWDGWWDLYDEAYELGLL